MTQRQLDTLVSRATGESRRVVHRLGFSIADPAAAAYDPEPSAEQLEQYLDWDDAQRERAFATA